jgi:hypothetical protein
MHAKGGGVDERGAVLKCVVRRRHPLIASLSLPCANEAKNKTATTS